MEASEADVRGATAEYRQGRCRWFNDKKGYGFIVPDEGGPDVFCHYSAVVMQGYKTLEAGQAVTYRSETTEKGEAAVEVYP